MENISVPMIPRLRHSCKVGMPIPRRSAKMNRIEPATKTSRLRKTRRCRQYCNPNGQKGGSPNHVDREERQKGLEAEPRRLCYWDYNL